MVAEVDTQDGIEGLVLVLPAAGQKQNGPLIGVADLTNDVFVGGADGAPIQVLPEAPNPRACGRALERVCVLRNPEPNWPMFSKFSILLEP